MKNIYNYIEEYKNNELDEINVLDALVFSRLSYIHIEELNDKLPFTIFDLSNYLKNIKISLRDKKFLLLLANSKRYKSLVITRCKNILDNEKTEQFFALTIELPKNILFVAFRGTNKSITGFKEDLDLSYKTIPSQIDALNYINEEKYKTMYLSGHSKGGNLAMYALIKSNLLRKSRIKKVYNFDGPGFLYLDSDYYLVKEKIENYFPNCSIVGRLLKNESNTYVFKTLKKGIEGHNIYNWIISDDNLSISSFLPISDEFKKETDLLLSKINSKRREKIIHYFYSVLNKERIKDLKKFDFKDFKRIIMNVPDIQDEEKTSLLRYFKVFMKISFLELDRKKEKDK